MKTILHFNIFRTGFWDSDVTRVEVWGQSIRAERNVGSKRDPAFAGYRSRFLCDYKRSFRRGVALESLIAVQWV